MRIGRSLSPGKVFLEKDGVLRKIEPDQMKLRGGVGRSGFERLLDTLVQWGVSESLIVMDEITFPVAFMSPPSVQVQVQGAAATISNITATGFSLRTRLASVPWTAVGR